MVGRIRARYDFVMVTLVLLSAAVAAGPSLQRFELSNGIKVVMVHAAGAPRQTMFTFVPATLVNDDAGRAQWSHLLEHMVLRSTDPIGLQAEGVVFNGETTHSYLRLETFAEPANWKRAIERHGKWMLPTVVDDATLVREKANIAQEEQHTASGGFTTKFALAAWHQIVRHGLTHANVHGDVRQATAPTVLKYAQQRVIRNASITIASIGPVPVDDVKAELQRVMEHPLLERGKNDTDNANALPSIPETRLAELRGTWDLPTTHALVFWPLPDRQPATLAAASVIARAVQVALAMKTRSRPEGPLRNALAYPIVEAGTTPLLLIDCCVTDGAPAPEQIAAMRRVLATLHEDQMLGMVSTMLLNELSLNGDFTAIRSQLPPMMKDNAEGLWLLGIMNYEQAWGQPIDQVAAALKATTVGQCTTLIDALHAGHSGSLVLEPKRE